MVRCQCYILIEEVWNWRVADQLAAPRCSAPHLTRPGSQRMQRYIANLKGFILNFADWLKLRKTSLPSIQKQFAKHFMIEIRVVFRSIPWPRAPTSEQSNMHASDDNKIDSLSPVAIRGEKPCRLHWGNGERPDPVFFFLSLVTWCSLP